MTLVSIIVAVSTNNIIGANGGMPWNLPSDLKRFRRLTMGKPIVMGRKTHDSIGRALDGRVNIVITRKSDYSSDGVIVCDNIDKAIAHGVDAAAGAGVAEICIIGGGEIYRAALDKVTRIYLTRVHLDVEGDVVFPVLDPETWLEISNEPCKRHERDSNDTSFHIFERRIAGSGPH